MRDKSRKKCTHAKVRLKTFFLIFCLSLIETKNISAQIFVSRLRLSKPGTQSAVPLCTPMRRAVAVMLMLRKTALDGNFPQIALIKSSFASDLFRFSRHVLACQREKLLDQLHLLARLHWHCTNWLRDNAVKHTLRLLETPLKREINDAFTPLEHFSSF